MVDTMSVFATVLLLSLGTVALALGALAWTQSPAGRRWRAVAPLVAGIAALAAMTFLLWGTPWEELRADVLWPLLVVSAAAASGAGAGAGLIYILVAAR